MVTIDVCKRELGGKVDQIEINKIRIEVWHLLGKTSTNWLINRARSIRAAKKIILLLSSVIIHK